MGAATSRAISFVSSENAQHASLKSQISDFNPEIEVRYSVVRRRKEKKRKELNSCKAVTYLIGQKLAALFCSRWHALVLALTLLAGIAQSAGLLSRLLVAPLAAATMRFFDATALFLLLALAIFRLLSIGTLLLESESLLLRLGVFSFTPAGATCCCAALFVVAVICRGATTCCALVVVVVDRLTLSLVVLLLLASRLLPTCSRCEIGRFERVSGHAKALLVLVAGFFACRCCCAAAGLVALVVVVVVIGILLSFALVLADARRARCSSSLSKCSDNDDDERKLSFLPNLETLL